MNVILYIPWKLLPWEGHGLATVGGRCNNNGHSCFQHLPFHSFQTWYQVHELLRKINKMQLYVCLKSSKCHRVIGDFYLNFFLFISLKFFSTVDIFFFKKRGKIWCSTLVIRSIQIKTTIQLLEWLKFKRLTLPHAGEDVAQLELSCVADGITKWRGHFGRMVWQFLRKLNIHQLCDSTILLPGIYPRKLKTYVNTKTHNVPSSFIHNSRKLETAQISINR